MRTIGQTLVGVGLGWAIRNILRDKRFDFIAGPLVIIGAVLTMMEGV